MAKKQLSETAGQDVARYIREHLGETLVYTTIDELCGTNSSNQQYSLIVGPLVKDGVLRVQRKKLIRGNEQSPIHYSYRICKELPATLTYSSAFMEGGANMGVLNAEVADLNPLLSKNGFLVKNLGAAKGWHDELQMLGLWLDEHPEIPEPAIMEERSFEVFHNEKLLGNKDDRRGGRTLLELINNLGLASRLNITTDTHLELVYYVPRSLRRVLTILVVENHAPFVHVQEALQRGVRTFFGRHVDGVVYGRGSTILAGDTLGITERLFSNGNPVRYLYWGDIDRPGIEVYERLVPDYEIEPLVAAYKAMIEHAGSDLPVSTGVDVPPHMGVDIASKLEPVELEVFMRAMVCCLRIPQEAVPPSLYDGTAGTQRLALSLRSRRQPGKRTSLVAR